MNQQQTKKAVLYGITLENYSPQELAEFKQLLDSQSPQEVKITYVPYYPVSTYPTTNPYPWWTQITCDSGLYSGSITIDKLESSIDVDEFFKIVKEKTKTGSTI